MLYADNVTRGLTAAFAPDGGKVDPAILRNAIKELLRGREFLETIESYLAVDDAKSLLFILYPWGIAQSQASAIISLVFFLCMALMSLVSFSCSVLIVVSALQVCKSTNQYHYLFVRRQFVSKRPAIQNWYSLCSPAYTSLQFRRS